MAGLRAKHKADRHQRIIEAAARLFRSQGYDTVKMEAITAAAEVSIGTIYNYYRNKGDLLVAIVSMEVHEVLAAGETVIADPPRNAEKAVARLVANYIEHSLVYLSKEMWRQGSHLQLLRSHGVSLRLLRFPLLSVGAWVLDAMALSALLDGFPHVALFFLLVSALPALFLSLRQSRRHRDPLLTLQLWGLHWLRLHLAGAAFILSLFNRTARRPARG